ncbi:MAG: hypothetical protein CL676_02355 [Bdellovibrionaceae bacterium]|nr:hypothetical protein [Pseudobdellovibrionaceae bacterium]|tara:strand:+ start:13542 stop:14402 length:861 start_codon:yes stop_codon:yes gene_type:complete
MFVETNLTLDKIMSEMNQLSEESWESLAPLVMATDHLLFSRENSHKSFRRLHFLTFELMSQCQNQELDESQRLEHLVKFFFEEKNFMFEDADSKNIESLSLSRALIQFSAHPFVGTLLFLHLSQALQIPLFWISCKNRYLIKWLRSGRSEYLDLLCGGQKLSDEEVLKSLDATSSDREFWTPREVYRVYLELLTKYFESTSNVKALHLAYNLSIQLDERNTHLLGRRAFLRHRLGYIKDAHADLKRYFSFVDHNSAPFEIQDLYHKVLKSVEQSAEVPTGPGPIYH